MISDVESEVITSNREPNNEISLSPTCAGPEITTEIKTPDEGAQALSNPNVCWLRKYGRCADGSYILSGDTTWG